MARGYQPEEWEYQETERGEQLENGVLGVRTKTIKSGEYLECEIFPIVIQDHQNREQRRKKSSEKIKRQNKKNQRKKVTRLLNANFGPGDLLAHFTSKAECSEEEFKKETRKFMRKLRARFRKAGVALKYLYVTEGTGAEGNRKWHIHMALNGEALSRDEIEALWTGGLSRVDRVQDQEKGLAGFAAYITQRKETQEKLLAHGWNRSRNLKDPEKSATVSTSRFSRRATWKIEEAARRDDWKALKTIYAKKYPGYELIEKPEIRYSEYLPGAYVYAWLRKIKDPAIRRG